MKNLWFVLTILVIFVLTGCKKNNNDNLPDDNNDNEDEVVIKKEPILGTWIWGSELYDQSPVKVVEKLSKNNVTDAFLLVKGLLGTQTPDYLLKDFIKRAHSDSIKVHFWYVVSGDQKYLDSHPQAHIYHCPKPSIGYNEPYPMDDERVNLLYPGYKEYVLKKIHDLITNYNCDGIHLDYIRYSHFVYSFDKNHLEKAASMGCDTARILNMFVSDYNYYAYQEGFVKKFSQGDDDVVKWVELRKNTVYDYIKSIKEVMTEENPDLLLSAAFMPEGAVQPVWADSYYSQNYALNAELLDFIAPMSYFKDYDKPTSWIKEVTESAIDMVKDSCRICSGIQAYNGVTAEQIKEQMNYAQDAKADGALFFRYGSVTNDAWDVIKDIYSNWPVDEE